MSARNPVHCTHTPTNQSPQDDSEVEPPPGRIPGGDFLARVTPGSSRNDRHLSPATRGRIPLGTPFRIRAAGTRPLIPPSLAVRIGRNRGPTDVEELVATAEYGLTCLPAVGPPHRRRASRQAPSISVRHLTCEMGSVRSSGPQSNSEESPSRM
jgi:hypothetical protein